MIGDEPLPLAAEFPRATRQQWLALVDAVLKGQPFDRRLVSTTYDGLRIEPLYERASGEPSAGRAPAAPWQVMQRVDHPDPAVANVEALHDLENGATGLTLVCAGSIGARGYGIDASPATIARVLEGVHLEAGIAVECELSPQMRDAPLHVIKLLADRGIDPAAVQLRPGLDPLSLMAQRGESPVAWETLAPIFAERVANLAAHGLRGPFAAADARPVHAAGGSEAQELAFALATALAYLRALEAGGVALPTASRMIFFRLAADADQFLTMAKFRALRSLWARVEAACGLVPEPVFISAETAWRMMTQRDPYVNMLRTTIAAVAAGLGGANAITVLPFTAALGLPDRFARRIARNTQLILLEESNLARVADPAAGSGALEDLTAKLCTEAWSLFRQIEAAGGAAAALEQGLLQKKIAAVRAEREKAVALRRDALTGTSEFPDLHDVQVAVIKATPVALSPLPPAVTFEALPPYRLAEPFEALRDAADRVLAATGARPKVLLAALGNPADVTARATFAANFFAAGGIEAVTVDAADRDAIIAALRDAGAAIACLCGTDEAYGRDGAEAARALVAAGAKHVYLAGRPKEQDALRQAGVGTLIFAGCDALATLRAAHDILGMGR
jgi:methylmalonyl-CoA mutase